MDTHLPKVCQPKLESNRLLKATFPTQNAPAILSHQVQNRTGSMYNVWEVDPSLLQHVARNEYEQLISTVYPHPTAPQQAYNKPHRKTPTQGNSSSPRFPRMPHKPPNSTEVVMHSMISDAVPPQHQRAHYLLAQDPSRPNNNHHPHQRKEQAHKSSVNLLRRLYPPKSPRCCRRIVHRPRRRRRSIEMIQARRPRDGRWQRGNL
jgi:hypothetical protein